LLLQFLVIELEQQVVLLDHITYVHSEHIDQPVDFRSDRHLLGWVISPAALTAKSISRNSAAAVVGGWGWPGPRGFSAIIPNRIPAKAGTENCD